jgi:hypothetical protein
MPQAMHTVLEVVYFRWDVAAHSNLLFFSLMACLIVTAMLILGGVATLNALIGLFALFPRSLPHWLSVSHLLPVGPR